MTEIRPKDRLFLAVVVPLAAVAAYWYGWRAEAGAELSTLESRRAALVSAGDFEDAFAKARRERKAAEAELEAERNAARPAVKVKADPAEAEADREAAVLEVFREAGLKVISGERIEGGGVGAVLQAAGCRPGPVARRYSLEGTYPQVMDALARFAGREMAVVAEKVEMCAPGSWRMEVAL